MSTIAPMFSDQFETRKILVKPNVLQAENVGQPPLGKKTVQDASFEICEWASLVQRATTSVNLAAQQERPYDVNQWLGSVRSLLNAIGMKLDEIEAMVQR